MSRKTIKKFLSVLVCLAMLIGLLPGVVVAEDGPNLISNSGFEVEANNNQYVPQWYISSGALNPDGTLKTGIVVQVTNEQQSSGSKSLYISDSSASSTGSVAATVYSEAMSVIPGQNTILKFKAFDTKLSISAAIRFYRSANDAAIGGQISSQNAKITSTGWTENVIEAKVPEGATVARILFYTVGSSTGSSYIDDVYFGIVQSDPGSQIKYTLENLGPQVQSVSVSRTVFGRDANGRLMAYSLVNGTPCSLVVTDVAAEKVIAQLPISDTVNGTPYTTTPTNRGLAAMPDGTVYICGTPTFMYKYVPGAAKVEFIRTTLGSQAFDMKAGPDDLLFVSTYSNSEAFEYNTKTNEIKSLGSVMPGESYAYSLAYDVQNNDLYFGIGSHAHLVKYDRDTGERTEIALPEPYATVGNFVWDLKVVEGKLFMRFSPGGTVAYDIKTGTFDSTGSTELTSRFFSEKSPIDNKVYYTTNGAIGYYNLNDKSYTVTDKEIEGYGTGFSFAQLNEAGYPGHTLIGVTRYGRLFKYNLETGNHKYTLLNIKGEATTLQNVSRSKDGRIHITGYLTGGTAIYDPVTGQVEENSNQSLGLGQSLPQSDTQYQYKDKTLFTSYPNAKVHFYDPTKPWDYSFGQGTNPTLLFSAYDVGEQDRIFAGYVIEEKNKAVFGTVPKYGLLGGALAIYDFDTAQSEIFWNIIPNQSITALTYKDGFIYGGSDIWGGMGQDPREKEAKLFIWDVEKKQLVYETVPVPGKRGITAMILAPDGKIWGNAEGYLFIFNPATRQVEYTQKVADVSYDSSVWRDAVYEIGTDGNLYATQRNTFFKVDMKTREKTVIRDEGKKVRFTQDDFGNFYLIEELNLLKLSIPELILKPTGASMSASANTLHRGETADISIKGLLEKGGTINYLERRETQYISSNPSVAAVENGVIKAENPGTTEISAVVNIEGKQSVTNKVTVTVEVTLESLSNTLNRHIESGSIDNAMAVQLTNSLKQALLQKDKGGYDKAIKHMEDFIKHLNNAALEKFIRQPAKEQLETDAGALIAVWTNIK